MTTFWRTLWNWASIDTNPETTLIYILYSRKESLLGSQKDQRVSLVTGFSQKINDDINSFGCFNEKRFYTKSFFYIFHISSFWILNAILNSSLNVFESFEFSRYLSSVEKIFQERKLNIILKYNQYLLNLLFFLFLMYIWVVIFNWSVKSYKESLHLLTQKCIKISKKRNLSVE